MTDFWTLAVIVALAGVTVLARGFFFIPDKPWTLPRWAERGLQYAPIAALAAVVLPEILTTQGQLIRGWDARVFGAIAGVAAFYWRRSVLATIGAGMAVYLPLHLGLGW
jgi:branched-subunit amino acid transport protein